MTYTNATAMTAALELLADCGDAELLAKLGRMAEIAAKPKAKSDTPSKAQRQNAILAESLAKFMWDTDATDVTSSDLVDTCGIAEIATTQKAIALLKIASQNGWVVRKEVKSKVLWGLGEVDPR